jgi:putative Holliday junction resolvase
VTPAADDMMPPRGRLIAVDVGGARVGLAVCDADRVVVSPLETLYRKNAEIDGQFFRRVVRDQEPVGFVVGLPVHMSGEESVQSAKCRRYGDWLRTRTGLPVTYWDERCTSSAAESMLWDAGLSHARRKARQDQVAAMLFLQSYLDAQRITHSPPEPASDAVVTPNPDAE